MDIQIERKDQVDCRGRTPLHIAAATGDLEMVRYLMRRRPELVTEVDYTGASPLHLASKIGLLQIVKQLLLSDVNRVTCLLQDNNGNTPLHTAARWGKTDVVIDLLGAKQDAFLLHDINGETPLHVAANFHQIEVATHLIDRLSHQQQPALGEIKHTLKLQRCVIRCGSGALEQIIQTNPNFLNDCDDKYHNTLLHTATEMHNEEMVTFLVRRDHTFLAKNKKGLTALDIAERSSQNYEQIRNLLRRRTWEREHMAGNLFENKRNAILVTASIIASMAFAAGLNPPGGVWQEDKQSYGNHRMASIGTSIMASTNPFMYIVFLGITTSAFVLSMCIIMLLISEIRLSRISFIHSNRNIFMHLLTVGMWFAITLIGCSFFQALHIIVPTTVNENGAIPMSIISMFLWLILTGIILLDRANIAARFLTRARLPT